jgi:NAD(P)-dependent dehydrogenase (short-subunit alcohol dehydrogenase family)
MLAATMNAGRRAAVVSGAGSGLGRVLAIELAHRGYPLALLGRREEPLLATLAAAESVPERGLALPCDVRDAGAVERAVARIEEQFGGVEIVVPAAGIAHLGRLMELPAEEFAGTIATNLTGAFLLIRAALPGMVRRGRGWIFPLLSVAARRTFPDWGAYAASKWGLAAVVATLREELAGTGVRITALYPGATDTPIWDGLGGDWKRSTMVPAGEVARALAHALDADPRTLVEEIHWGPAGGAL